PPPTPRSTLSLHDALPICAALIERGLIAASISGDVAQKDRERIVGRLRDGSLQVLVATDVAARGLDVDRIGLVVNFDVPRERRRSEEHTSELQSRFDIVCR